MINQNLPPLRTYPAPHRTAARYGFSLAETMIALTLVAVVLLPATVAMHRLFNSNQTLEASLEDELILRRTVASQSLAARFQTVPAPRSTVREPDGAVFSRINFTAGDSDTPDQLAVQLIRGTNFTSQATLALPPRREAEQ